jgi:transketolase
LEIATNFHGAPTLIIAHTIKGKGVSYMEHNNKWHVGQLSAQLYQQTMEELEGEAQCL